MTTTKTSVQAAAQVHAALDSAIPEAWKIDTSNLPVNVSSLAKTSGILSANEIAVLDLDGTAIRDAIASSQLTATQALTAFAKSAAILHQATNCLTQFFFDEALARAKWLDEEMERTGKPVGLLHGVPISIKDTVGLKGHCLYAGLASRVDFPPAAKDGTLVAALRDAGAVFYCKSSVPQAVMQLESDSFLGPTLNPFNTRLTPGGSSGGEGVLVGARGSPMGIGSDIGGSIRCPAAHNGIYGFKPTASRLPKSGSAGLMAGQDTIAGAIGPMCSSARDINLIMQVVSDAETWAHDFTCTRNDWDLSKTQWRGGDKPIIGVMWHDGVVLPQPPMSRALNFAVDKLRVAGFHVIDYAPFEQAKGWSLISELYYADGGERISKFASDGNEPVYPLNQWLMSHSKLQSAQSLLALCGERDKFRAAYQAHFLATGVDVILSPPGPGPAPVCGTSRYWSYTSIFNLVDYPSAVFPTGLSVSTESDPIAPAHVFMSSKDEEIYRQYDPLVFEDAPLSLMVSMPRGQDEATIVALDIISKVVRE